MITVYSHVQATDELLAAFLGAISGFGKQDQSGTGTPGRSSTYSVEMRKSAVAVIIRLHRGMNLLDKFSQRFQKIRASCD